MPQTPKAFELDQDIQNETVEAVVTLLVQLVRARGATELVVKLDIVQLFTMVIGFDTSYHIGCLLCSKGFGKSFHSKRHQALLLKLFECEGQGCAELIADVQAFLTLRSLRAELGELPCVRPPETRLNPCRRKVLPL